MVKKCANLADLQSIKSKRDITVAYEIHLKARIQLHRCYRALQVEKVKFERVICLYFELLIHDLFCSLKDDTSVFIQFLQRFMSPNIAGPVPDDPWCFSSGRPEHVIQVLEIPTQLSPQGLMLADFNYPMILLKVITRPVVHFRVVQHAKTWRHRR